ncbi:DNA polymerase IV [soil metagenome]
MNIMNKIIHVDMDAFFASVEQRDFPELKGKPVAVGGNSERGVVAAASYEARAYGVFSAMSSRVAIRKCPHLIFAKPRFEVYKKVSNQIREIFYGYTDLVEPLSLDEAYLDVTKNKKGITSAVEVAKVIKQEIFVETKLTASAGISYNKFLAKTASSIKKPDGLTLIHPNRAENFISSLPIEKFFGVGKVTAEKMKNLGIKNGYDLKQKELEFLVKNFGKLGQYYFDISRGLDNRPVNPNRIRKSAGAENTFFQDLYHFDELKASALPLLDKAFNHIKKAGISAKTITLKIKYNDFEVLTRSKTLTQAIYKKEDAILILNEILLEFNPPAKGIRLVGVSFSNFEGKEFQLTLEF